MTFPIEKFISNFIRSQFPSFYETEGETFVLFVQAYYEWLEKDGNAVGEARNLFDYRDIDLTIEDFLVHFQQKYLYGIPYDIISNKKFLLKHIQDIYRSKGTDRCYQLLFRLIYNQDIEIYKPTYDVLRVSDGTWFEPKFLEVTDSPLLSNLVGKQVIGSVSKTIAIVEKHIYEPINENIVSTLFISNITPQGASFDVGEKILDYANTESYSLFDAPTIIGSLKTIKIVSGGDGFNPGDVLAIADRDINTNLPSTSGKGGKLRVTKTAKSQGTLEFFISEAGFGYLQNTSVYFYKGLGDNSGYGASFEIGPIGSVKNLTYNTDLIIDYKDTLFNASQYNFPYYAIANSGNQIEEALAYRTDNFGSVYALTNINPGNNYIVAPDIFVRSSIPSKSVGTGTVYYSNSDIFVLRLGNISYNTGSNILTGSGSLFTTIFSPNDVIGLGYSNSSGISEYKIISSVDSDTQLTLDSNPAYNSTATAFYYKIPSIQGSGTSFTSLYANDDIIGVQANATLSSTYEQLVIKQVVNNSLIILYGPPTHHSTASSEYFVCPSIMTSSYALYEPSMYMADGTIPGLNAILGALPNNGNNIISEVVAYDSGKGYTEGEYIKAYLYNSITTPQVVTGGTGYSNGEQLVFAGGTISTIANGFITTNTTGGIVQTTLLNSGANYTTLPVISVKTANGSGAILKTSISGPNNYNTYSVLVGKVTKGGVGVAPGNWTTTRGFLDSDKYIQGPQAPTNYGDPAPNSYFYQDFSYQIRVANTLDKYKKIIYNTFHTAGMELFGAYADRDILDLTIDILFEDTGGPEFKRLVTSDDTFLTVDNVNLTSDAYYSGLTVDSSEITSDYILATADSV